MTSNKSGREVANQFIIKDETGRYFQSYKSIIAFIPVSGRTCQDKNCDIVNCTKNKILLDEYYWNYSRTTSKYRSMFLGETTKETLAKIKSGEYVLTNLN